MQNHTRRGLSVLAFLATISIGAPAIAETPLYQDRNAPIEARVEDLLKRLTLDEKAVLMTGGTMFGSNAIERLGVPALEFADGPNGVHLLTGKPSTAFPAGVVSAATWNPSLIERMGKAMGEEAAAGGIAVILGPNVNIQRAPLAGRNFEAYSEDPYLAGKIGAGFVRGVQAAGVGTSVKHFAANNQEFERDRGNSSMSERALREIYLPHFEMIVKEARPWTVMASYNRLNGVYMSENRTILTDILKNEWGFDGVVMSDWTGTHSTLAAAAGLDLEMPGPGRHFGPRLADAARRWQIEPAALDEGARRMLRLILRTGALDGARPKGEINTPAHWAAARDVAAEGIALLKNDNAVLPLDKGRLKSLAVIGPNADAVLIQGGGSAQVMQFRDVTPLDAIRAAAGSSVAIAHVQGVDNEPIAPALDPRLLYTARNGGEQGLRASYFANGDFKGEPALAEIDRNFFKMGFGQGVGARGTGFSARWQGYLRAPATGDYELSLIGWANTRIFLDGKEVLGPASPAKPTPILAFFNLEERTARLALEAGKAYAIRIDYRAIPRGQDEFASFNAFRVGLRRPPGTIEQAVAAAKAADTAIVFVGASTTSETEGADRESMELFGDQNALVEAVLAANPNTVVVLNNGAPLALPWADKAHTLVEAWLPGQEGGYALADILLGDVNPSGKLPVSFPRRIEDNPTYLTYPGGRDADYGEGVFVGYRYYDKKKIEPLFPFGHGLSYTNFDYGGLDLPASFKPGETVKASVTIKNAGARAGMETVQLYVEDVKASEARPINELKAFEKVALEPGESRTVTFDLGPRAFSFYDPYARAWRAEPGEFRIHAGSSSRDIRASGAIELKAE